MSLNYHAIGQRIKNIREGNHLSQEKLAELLGKSPTFISYVETGRRSMSLETLVQVANALKTSTDILLAEQRTGAVIAASQEITMILTDCNDFERLVITDTLKSIKTAMRKHNLNPNRAG